MIGGWFGFVGLGRVRGSQKTTPREDRSFFSEAGFSGFKSMELCDTPVHGALEIREAAAGVVVCRMGREICGLLVTAELVLAGGRVDDLLRLLDQLC